MKIEKPLSPLSPGIKVQGTLRERGAAFIAAYGKSVIEEKTTRYEAHTGIDARTHQLLLAITIDQLDMHVFSLDEAERIIESLTGSLDEAEAAGQTENVLYHNFRLLIAHMKSGIEYARHEGAHVIN